MIFSGGLWVGIRAMVRGLCREADSVTYEDGEAGWMRKVERRTCGVRGVGDRPLVGVLVRV